MHDCDPPGQAASRSRPATHQTSNPVHRYLLIRSLLHIERHLNNNTKAYLVGGGIGSLSAAAFMIRDGGIPGSSITIFEAMPVPGSSLDVGGNPEVGYTLRGGRMLTTDNYECTCDLFKTIPSWAPGVGRCMRKPSHSMNTYLAGHGAPG